MAPSFLPYAIRAYLRTHIGFRGLRAKSVTTVLEVFRERRRADHQPESEPVWWCLCDEGQDEDVFRGE